MLRLIFLTVFLPSLVMLTSCVSERQKHIEQSRSALSLAIDNNIKYRSFEKKSSNRVFSRIKVTVLLLPLNEEIINATVNLKCAQQGIDQKDCLSIQIKNNDAFVRSGKVSFILFIVTNKLRSDEWIQLSDIDNNVTLNFEDGNALKIDSYTPSLGVKLNPGWNAGFIFFKGIIPNNATSFSVHFNGMRIGSKDAFSKNYDNIDSHNWAFAYDKSDMNYLTLLKDGLTEEEIRENYFIPEFEYASLEGVEFVKIVALLLKIVSKM